MQLFGAEGMAGMNLLLVVGGDARFTMLADKARRAGFEGVSCRGSGERDRVEAEDIASAGALLMPNPFRGRWALPHAGCALTINEVMRAARPGARVMLFGSDEMPLSFRARHGDAVRDILKYEPFVIKNALLTAEGGIASAMEKSDEAICGANCMVIGYGRIGRALTRMLMGLGGRVTVCARRAEVRAQAAIDGAEEASMGEMPGLIGGMRFIFSTVPERVMGTDSLINIAKGAVLIDLGSLPYSFDIEAAVSMGVTAAREPGLPGRYCPGSAADALLGAALELIEG